jgi:hypothetical protein
MCPALLLELGFCVNEASHHRLASSVLALTVVSASSPPHAAAPKIFVGTDSGDSEALDLICRPELSGEPGNND